MEASVQSTAPSEAPAESFDVKAVHEHLDAASEAYHACFKDRVADEAHRFKSFLSTVRMIVDQSADTASKDAAAKEQA